MEICGIQCFEDLAAINTVVSYQLIDPEIEIVIGCRKSDNGLPFKVTVKTYVEGLIYSSVRFYVTDTMIIPSSISTEFEILLIKESVRHHIEYIKETTSKDISESFYENRINEVVSMKKIFPNSLTI